jgi:hypothetical protein
MRVAVSSIRFGLPGIGPLPIVLFQSSSSSSSIFDCCDGVAVVRPTVSSLPLARFGSGGASPYRVIVAVSRFGSGGASPYRFMVAVSSIRLRLPGIGPLPIVLVVVVVLIFDCCDGVAGVSPYRFAVAWLPLA